MNSPPEPGRMSSPTEPMESVRDDIPIKRAELLARRQGGVISRRQLLDLGVPRWRTRAQVAARRWRRHHRQTIAIHTALLPPKAKEWSAVFEAGSRGALDGSSSLIAAGLTGFSEDRQRVSVPRGAKVFRSSRINIRQTRRWRREDIDVSGVPRVRTEVAAVHAAFWAVSDRQAALILSMVVQQRLASAEDVAVALLDVRRDRRRKYIERVLLDLMGGAESLGELDVARKCRRRGLPEPDRQVVRQGRNGSYFLDVYWRAFGVVLEVDGIHHIHAQNVVGDALRQNHLSLDGDTVLRLPLLGLRVAEDDFFDQIETALRRGGWERRKTA